MRNPILHGAHGNPVNFIPKIYLLINKMLIVDKGALETYFVGQNEAFVDIFHMQISSLDHAIKKPIVNEVVAHGLSYNNIDILIKILKEDHINDMLPLIFLNDFLHHILILDLYFAMSIDGADNPLGSHLSCVDGVQTITAGGEVKNCLINYLVMIICNCFDVGLAGRIVRHRCLQCLQPEVIYFGKSLLNFFHFSQLVHVNNNAQLFYSAIYMKVEDLRIIEY